MEYKHYKITIKEAGLEKPIETEYHGIIDNKGLIAYYGLNNSDVEGYEIDEIVEWIKTSIVMSIFELFTRYKCTKDEKERLLDYLCAIRIKRIIKEIDSLHKRTT